MTIAFVLACVAHQPVVTRGVERPDPPYERVHDDETRTLRLYGQLATELLLRATLLTDDVRAAGAAELAYRDGMTRAEADAYAAQTAAEGAAEWDVVFTADRAHEDARVFGTSEKDPWRVRLLIGTTECTPMAVEKISKPTAAQMVLYPQVSAWSDLWIARFQKNCGSQGPAIFTVAGPRASGEVHFD